MAGASAEDTAVAQAEAPSTTSAILNSPGVVTARLAGFADEGRTPLVILPAPNDQVARRARAAVDLHGAHVGRELVVAFDGGDPQRPIILALLRGLEQDLAQVAHQAPASPSWQLRVDGERCILSAQHELVLECGPARLILRADGRAELRGNTVITEATDANKIRGGSVQLN